ncbi:YopX family protein [Caldibacillus thermolactis]|jgi:uncharacterized phage protein (TIGR01671 family)|uniref:YopX family protein n=1 Tax=Pallidibacillus thermolactis TaxID=251051 RepID=A0ABT2WG21_9BACI|nr:YopX family protein [Pallidibacillus thermolactis]MCU9594613.1 YopX family protein [Pallidibacillus thermolactis]
MREIKFQVFTTDWEGVTGCFEGYFLQLLDNGEYKVAFTNSVNDFDIITTERENIRFFTGLKDKNGKEIYEGDICETVTYSGKPFGTIDVVKFSGGAFKLTDIEDALLPIPLDDSDIQSVEVIGNIFEHPHLIGGKHG